MYISDCIGMVGAHLMEKGRDVDEILEENGCASCDCFHYDCILYWSSSIFYGSTRHPDSRKASYDCGAADSGGGDGRCVDKQNKRDSRRRRR